MELMQNNIFNSFFFDKLIAITTWKCTCLFGSILLKAETLYFPPAFARHTV